MTLDTLSLLPVIKEKSESLLQYSPASASSTSPTDLDSRRPSATSTVSADYDSSTPRFAVSNSAWADGLRGIAAVFVMCSHIVLTIDTGLVNPCCGPDEHTPKLFQRPILRLVAQGQSWVSTFILLSGFVNALKPIQCARSGETQKGLVNIAQSSFRRSFRLALPAAAATCVSWLLEQFGLYHYARHGQAYWPRHTSPPEFDSFTARVMDLFSALAATWSYRIENHYDQPQWAMKYLLEGSMFVFMVLVMTIYLKPLWRSMVLCVLYYWSQDWSYIFLDPLVGMNVFAGILLAELFIVTSDGVHIFVRAASMVLTPFLLVLSLTLMSVPMDNWDRVPWSSKIMSLTVRILPAERESPRGAMALGCQLLVLCIIMSPWLRRLLSARPLLWLGKVSFGIYLLHGPLLRSLFTICVYLGSTLQPFTVDGEPDVMELRYPLPGVSRIACSLVLFVITVGGAAHVWTMKMEPIFAKITKNAEQIMFAKPVESKRKEPSVLISPA